jgi:nucleoside-diphosphate-sugar epimerase
MLSLLLLLSLCSAQITPRSGQVLVLGSGGLVGTALVDELRSQGFSTLEIRNRRHVDLRDYDAFTEHMSQFNPQNISFAFFLACEVGGSKFLESGSRSVQLDIIEFNLQMYRVLLPWFKEHQIPYLFMSSSLQSKLNPYGSIKRLGEQYVEAIGIGKSVRLWNVFGQEPVGPRSRVITDWINACLTKQQIRSLTDGNEYRQVS